MNGFILNAGYLIAAGVTAPWWMRKNRGGWRERFGHVAPLPPKTARRVLVHGVSVGEVNLLRPLIEALRSDGEREPVVSSTTDTGIARARALFEPEVPVVRYPLDSSGAVRRFLDAVRPDLVLLAELEVWPNFLGACARAGVPVAVVNGRLSERSFRRYHALRGVVGGMFRELSFVCAQDETYAERFRAMDAARGRVFAVGTMKWDSAASGVEPAPAEALARELGVDRDRPLVVAGSTAPDEHALLHEAVPEDVQLLCAPRKPEWFEGAAAHLPGCVRRSARTPKAGATRFLLDTIGELRAAYALADVVVVGRSFGDLHGSDPMEPAALAKPVIIGPRFGDFEHVTRALVADDAILISARESLERDLGGLLADPARREALGAAGKASVERHRGATERTLELVLPLLGPEVRA
ncbi:MAG: glycosyltransferase N-terminal domain-containing protein [Planctomycetota bacterium]